MLFGKKIKEVSVNATDNNNLIWRVDTTGFKFNKMVRLNVGTGCQALVYINGKPDGAPREAGSYELYMKKVLKNHDKVEIIGVRRDAQFDIKFGLSESNSVPYEDKKSKTHTKVSIRGECYCKVIDGEKIYAAYGCQSAITPEDIRNNFFGEITQVLIDSLAKKLGEYDYLSIAQSVNDLSNTVKELTEKKLLAAGILLERCSVAQPYFGEDFGQQRRADLDDRDREKQQQDENEHIMRIVEKSVTANAQNDSKTLKCSKCGKQNPAGTKFCQFCGNKLF